MISVVIPVYNEEKSIKKTVEEIQNVLKDNNLDKNSEIIIVNDGSTNYGIYENGNTITIKTGNLYNGEEIVIPFTASVSQKIEEHGVIVNGYEVPTGRVNLVETHSGNNRGSFNMVLNLSTLTALDEYNIYFGINELNSNLHLYSDSSYQNEIDHISDIYDGINSEITKTIYWELETDNISTLSDGLYYIVY